MSKDPKGVEPDGLVWEDPPASRRGRGSLPAYHGDPAVRAAGAARAVWTARTAEVAWAARTAGTERAARHQWAADAADQLVVLVGHAPTPGRGGGA